MLRRSRTDDRAPERPAGQGVVVVCDDADAVELLARLVERDGHDVIRAASQGRALAELEQVPRAAVVVSLSATGGDVQMLEAVRTHSGPAVAEVPVLILADSDRNRAYAWQSGVDGFLVRPFHADELSRELAAVLERSDDERVAHRAGQLDDAGD